MKRIEGKNRERDRLGMFDKDRRFVMVVAVAKSLFQHHDHIRYRDRVLCLARIA